MLYFPLPPAGESPGADARTLSSPIPANDTDIGLITPRYTTFILSAEIVAELGFGTTT